MFQPLMGISEKIATFIAQLTLPGIMLFAAINRNHLAYHTLLMLNPFHTLQR